MQSGDGSLSSRGHWKRRLRFFLLACLSVYLLVRPRLESDTGWLVFEAAKELECLGHGQLTHCADSASQFPLFQMGPAMGLTALGLSSDWIIRAFAYLSILCFIASLFLIHRTLRRHGPWLARLGLLIYAGGYGICYSHSSFTEMAASTLALAVVAGELAGVNAWISAGVLCLAALTKETAAPFLLGLALLAQLIRRRSQTSGEETPLRMGAIARKLIPHLLGAATAIALAIGLNYFKFGTPFNLKYLQPFFFVSEPSRQVSFFFGQWFSPTSGIWLCWTSFAALFPVIAWRLFKKQKAGQLTRHRWLTWAGVSALMLILTVGFSKWFSPFGWIAWGPRLMLPWLPAALLLLLEEYGGELRDALAWLSRRPSLTAAVASVFALSVFANFRVLILRSLASQILDIPVCREGAFIESNPPQYYRCVDQLMWPWPEGWPLLKVFSPWIEPHSLVLAAIYAIGWLWYARQIVAESAESKDVRLT
jgi:hypothetical protein